MVLKTASNIRISAVRLQKNTLSGASDFLEEVLERVRGIEPL